MRPLLLSTNKQGKETEELRMGQQREGFIAVGVARRHHRALASVLVDIIADTCEHGFISSILLREIAVQIRAVIHIAC